MSTRKFSPGVRLQERLDQFESYGITVASALKDREEVERLRKEREEVVAATRLEMVELIRKSGGTGMTCLYCLSQQPIVRTDTTLAVRCVELDRLVDKLRAPLEHFVALADELDYPATRQLVESARAALLKTASSRPTSDKHRQFRWPLKLSD